MAGGGGLVNSGSNFVENLDLEIGAVEIKDGVTDNRAGVNADHRLLVDTNAPYAVRIDQINLGGSGYYTGFSGCFGGCSGYSVCFIDDTMVTNIIYIGKAVVGSLDASSTWQIKKVERTGELTKITWAAGSYSFDKVWDNRLTYTYV
jgi:hypothetical protein